MKSLSDELLEEMLDDIESELIERKRSFKGSAPDTARQAVCAFANDLPGHNKPGVIFIGAVDDGNPSMEPITDELLRTLADIKTDGNILPLPTLQVEKRRLKGADMAVITVYPSDMPPVKYSGRVWIRTGSRRGIATEQDERILSEKRKHKNIPYDLYPVSGADIRDLSAVFFENEYLPMAFAPDVLKENNRTYEERLAACKLIVSPSDLTPTVTGILAIGKNPQEHLPGAYVQFLRIFGNELEDDVIDEERIDGHISEMIRRTIEKVKAHNRRAVDVTSGDTHKITSTYPIVAVEQILYNAVLHRTYERTNAPIRVTWYNDRIEILSPGGTYGNVTPQNLGLPGITDYRNPNIATVMKVCGYVQTFGRGITIARNEMERNGNPLPEFFADSNIVRCVLMSREATG